MATEINIPIEEFSKVFSEAYAYCYENRDQVPGYGEALKFGDDFMKKHPDFVTEFAKYRGDYITSDREVVAFAFALEKFV